MPNKIINLSDRKIGENHPVFLIAEIGINHNGDINIAKKLIDAAFACNWDCVKFQKRVPEIAVPEEQKSVMRDTPWGRMTYLEYKHRVEFEKEEHTYIDEYCKEKPLMWTSSPWDIPSIDFLLNFDIPFLKIPSAKITEDEYLIHAASSGKAIIMSTGMSTVEEIDKAVNILEKHTSGNYALMHTNSTYPTPPEDINLKGMLFLKERYDCIIGYSGHEYDLEPSVIAVALGAKIIERHVTLDHAMWGSDQHASLEIHAMDMLYKRMKNVDIILGKKERKISKKEMEVRKKLRGY